MHVLWWIIVGLIAGWLTGKIMGGGKGVVGDILLGIGGVRLLRALGVQPSTFHMNEGHAAFLTFELLREKMGAGKSFEDAIKETKAECIFTTHTPVEAGHDRFGPDLMDYAMHRFRSQMPAPFPELMKLGRVKPDNQQEPFCMTVLALKLSRAANAVSELHGQVSREMWNCLWPDKKVEDVPIGHITNGIHLMSWMKGPVRRFWQRKLGTPPKSGPTGGETTEFWVRDPGMGQRFVHGFVGVVVLDVFANDGDVHFVRRVLDALEQAAPIVDIERLGSELQLFDY